MNTRKGSHRLRRNGPTLKGKDHIQVGLDTGVHYQTCYRIMTYRGIASLSFVDAVIATYGGTYDDVLEPCAPGQELVNERHSKADPRPERATSGKGRAKKPALEGTDEKNPGARDENLDPKPPESPAKPVKPPKEAKRQPWDKRKPSKDSEPAGGAEWHWWEYRQIVHAGKPMTAKRAKRAAVERVTAEQLDTGHDWADAEIALRGKVIREALEAGGPVPVYSGPPLFSAK